MGRRFLPDFFILGAQKSGTSTLHHILKSTDIVSLPKNKETHYFSHFINKNRNYSWYKKQFFIKDSHELIGEVDPSYIYIADTAKNIEKIIKNPKIIIILRKPIDRAFSHYSMSCRRGFEEHSFIKAILNEDKRLEKREEFNLNNFSYLDRGNYFFQIMKYKKIFKKSSFLFLKFDDLLDKKSKEKLIMSLFEFLGIKKQYKKFDFDTIHINKNKVFRFKWIQNILYRNSKLKILLSKMITDPNLRYRIKNFIEKINLTDSDDYKSTIIDNYKELPEKIINWNNHEVSQLEKITNLNLKNWHI